jgi:hypothetical protein
MVIVNVKIHPAIGIARLGNIPDEFFIGPELPWDRTIPDGGYKDEQCRVKRQAARFRIFAYHKDGSITKITEKEARITWTVHIANKKASVKNQIALTLTYAINILKKEKHLACMLCRTSRINYTEIYFNGHNTDTTSNGRNV